MNETVLINEVPFQIEIPEKNKLAYGKSYMHMLNEYALSEGVITQELFEKAKAMINKLEKV